MPGKKTTFLEKKTLARERENYALRTKKTHMIPKNICHKKQGLNAIKKPRKKTDQTKNIYKMKKTKILGKPKKQRAWQTKSTRSKTQIKKKPTRLGRA